MGKDAESLRDWMVDEQIMARGVYGKDVINSMRTVPRHLFVPEKIRHLAYDDGPLPIGDGQMIHQPYISAVMIQAAGLSPHSNVLEIGTGSGYQTAVIAQIVKKIYTIERIPHLAEKAQRVLKELHYNNAQVIVGDGSLGWKEEAPFDAILIWAGVAMLPKALENQVAENGMIIAPIGDRRVQKLMLYQKRKGAHWTEYILDWVRFPPLVGAQGWD